MNMNCHDCQMEILQHTMVSKEAQAHLDSCVECRAFASAAMLTTPPSPTPQLDAQVKSVCHGVLATRRLALRQLHLRRAFYAMAACLAILLGIVFYLQSTPETAPVNPPQIAIATPSSPANSVGHPAEVVPQVAENADTSLPQQSLLELYTEALSWDVDVSLSSTELDRMEFDLAMLNAGL